MKMVWKLSLVFVATLLIKGSDCQPAACGQAPLNTKIVGGVNASTGAWPWQVSLHTYGSHFCGGSLINNQWVLSAAHCFQGTPAAYVTVYLGRQSQELPNPNEVSRDVSLIIVHPNYNKGQAYNNDIALLRLSSPVSFNNYIQPVCLAEEASTFNSDTMWVTGWGTINTLVSLPSPQMLQEVAVPLVGNTKCNCSYNGAITENMMCAGELEGGKDSCQGDSGGPMVIKQGTNWIQAGVVSFGNGCGLPDIPGVYTRVSQYQQWISGQVNRTSFVTFNSTTPHPDENCHVLPLIATTPPTLCGGSANSWPWMANITYNSYPMCVGTLVSDRFVMTSTSCLSRSMGTDGWAVTIYAFKWDCSVTPMSFDVANVFSDTIFGNVVALMELSNQYFNLANVPVDSFSSFGPGTQCIVVGSGFHAPNSYFMEDQTTIVNCDPHSTTPINICTEPISFQQNGSPLLCRMAGMWVQTGLLSIPSEGGIHQQSSNSTVFIATTPFNEFLTNTINDYPSIWGGVESFSPLSLSCILLLSLPAVFQAIY